jgi:hypothetical protein
MLGHEGEAFAKTSSNCSGEGRASGWMQGRAARVVGLCGMVFLALTGCQQSRPSPVMEEDLLACQQRPENHSSQFCDRITRAYRIYMGTAEPDSDQNRPAQTSNNKSRAAELAPSKRRMQARRDEPPQPSEQLGANPFQARVATVYIGESFINEQFRQRLSNFELVKDLHMQLDPDSKRIFLEGLLRVPEVEMRSINLDPQEGEFRFRASLRARATPEGYLILEFPLNETYFYPKRSQGLESDRVIVPVQLMPLAIAGIRNYLAALSGNFSGFDRRTHTIRVVIQSYEKARAATNDPGERDYWTNQIASYNLQLQAIPIERRQLEQMSKDLGPMVDFLSAKDLNLNEVLRANKNAFLLHIRVSDLVPYLRDVDLGGIRIVRDKLDSPGETFLALDINAALGQIAPATDSWRLRRSREPMPKPPSLVVRLHQAIFVSTAILEAEKKTLSDKVDNLDIQMHDDGLHVSGRYRGMGLPVPFDAFVNPVPVETDVFEVRVKGLEVAGLDVPFLTGSVLNLLRNLLDHALEGRCTFEDLQQTADHERALRVHVGINKEEAPAPVVPAFPTLRLKSVEVQEREFILRLGL